MVFNLDIYYGQARILFEGTMTMADIPFPLEMWTALDGFTIRRSCRSLQYNSEGRSRIGRSFVFLGLIDLLLTNALPMPGFQTGISMYRAPSSAIATR